MSVASEIAALTPALNATRKRAAPGAGKEANGMFDSMLDHATQKSDKNKPAPDRAEAGKSASKDRAPEAKTADTTEKPAQEQTATQAEDQTAAPETQQQPTAQVAQPATDPALPAEIALAADAAPVIEEELEASDPAPAADDGADATLVQTLSVTTPAPAAAAVVTTPIPVEAGTETQTEAGTAVGTVGQQAAKAEAPETEASPLPAQAEGEQTSSAEAKTKAAEAAPQTDAAKPTAKPDSSDAAQINSEPGNAAHGKNAPDMLPQGMQQTHHAAQATATAAAQAPAQTQAPSAPVPLEGVAVEIASKSLSGKNHFEIRLDPPELGRIDVRLEIDREGQVSSRLVVDRQQTLDLLRRDAAGLERALQDAGLKTADNGLQFSLRDQSANQQQQDQSRTNDVARMIATDDTTLPPDIIVQRGYARMAAVRGGVDIRV